MVRATPVLEAETGRPVRLNVIRLRGSILRRKLAAKPRQRHYTGRQNQRRTSRTSAVLRGLSYQAHLPDHTESREPLCRRRKVHHRLPTNPDTCTIRRCS